MYSGNMMLRKAVEGLLRRMPSGWSVSLARQEARDGAGRADGWIRVSAPDGRTAELVVEVKQRLDPRRAMDLAIQARAVSGGGPILAVAPWISTATQARLRDGGVQFIDLTGNIHVALSEPGLFIEAAGAARDPNPEVRRATLKGAKAARVTRALCQGRPPMGVRELSVRAGTTPGYVSKLIAMLDQEAALERSDDGKVARVDLPRLLSRWSEDAPLDSRTTATTWIDPRGLPSFLKKLGSNGERYAVTASLAAERKAPIAAARLASVYVEDPDLFANALELRSAEAGANVVLLVPQDGVVFEDTWQEGSIRYAALPQVAADLLSGPGRGPAEAEALITWMTANPEVWRG